MTSEAVLDFGAPPSVDQLVTFHHGQLRPEDEKRVRDYLVLFPELYEPPERLRPSAGPVPFWKQGAARASASELAAAWRDFQWRLQEDQELPVTNELSQASADAALALAKIAAALPPVPSLLAVRSVVFELGRFVERLNQAAEVEEETEILVRQAVVQASFPVFSAYRSGEAEAAHGLLLSSWAQMLEAYTERRAPSAWLRSKPRKSSAVSALSASEFDLFPTFQAAVFEEAREISRAKRGQRTLQRLGVFLALEPAQIGEMFEVEGGAVREWLGGAQPISAEAMAALSEAEEALDLLLQLFQPDRLAEAIRRPAKLFDGQPALDWILAGRIREVARKYDLLLQYQS